jgi:hypothetical protein
MQRRLPHTASVWRRLGIGVVVIGMFATAGCGSEGAPTARSSSVASTDDSSSGASAASTAPTSSDPATTDSDTTAVTTDAPTTSAAPVTTSAPTTSAAPTTTTAPPLTAADLVLTPRAVGPIGFGTGVQPTIDVLTPVLGPPADDRSFELPDFDAATNTYTNAVDEVFAFPFARQVCFANGLCLSFGGATTAELQLVGYDYYGSPPAPPVLTTSSGLPLGARWADYPAAMTAYPGGCYSTGGGDSGGVTLVLQSSGDFFGVFEGESYVEQLPDPADVTVYGMYAGELVGYLYADC